MLLPQNVNNLVAQNAYVFILATGMLFCILTGGNIDLSVGSVVCFVAAVGGKMMVLNSMNPYLTMIVMLLVGIAIGAWQDSGSLMYEFLHLLLLWQVCLLFVAFPT